MEVERLVEPETTEATSQVEAIEVTEETLVDTEVAPVEDAEQEYICDE